LTGRVFLRLTELEGLLDQKRMGIQSRGPETYLKFKFGQQATIKFLSEKGSGRESELEGESWMKARVITAN